MQEKYIKFEYIFSSFNNRFLHMSYVLFYFCYPLFQFSYIHIAHPKFFPSESARKCSESTPGTLTVPFARRLHGSAPRYYNFVCTDDNSHPLSNPRKTSPRAGDSRVTRSRFAIPSLFCHPTCHPLTRCLGGVWRRILNFLEIECDGEVRRDSQLPRPRRGNV